jgi:hypothetical protein
LIAVSTGAFADDQASVYSFGASVEVSEGFKGGGETLRLLLTTLTILAAMICIGKPAEAQNYPWCAYYNYGFGGARNCGFVTYQQRVGTSLAE